MAAPNLPLRSRVEHASVPIVERMNALPRAVPFVAVIVLFVLAIVLGRWGWVPLLPVGAFVGWLMFLTWPRLTTAEKMMRGTVLVMVLAAMVVRAFPR